MNLRFLVETALPPLAWCAVQRRDGGEVTVVCGAGVLRGGDWFFEGSWSGPFQSAALGTSYRFGSGAAVDETGIRYYPPSHTLGRLHLLRTAERVIVSNSLAFTLAMSGRALAPDYPFHARNLYSVRLGLTRCRKSLPLTAGRMELAYVRPLVVDRALNVRQLDPPDAPAPFADFMQYRAHIQTHLAGVIANGSDSAREVAFRPIIALSSGYDSTAGAALLAPLGCKEALSFQRARKPAPELEDGGSAVAECLGMQRHVFEWDGYKALPGLPEAEFLAALPTGEDVSFAACADLLAGRLLFVGYHGDGVWSPNKTNAPDFVRGDSSGGSMEEFRLRVGFGIVPFAFIGAAWQRRINEIASSPEMDPWRIGGDYDRPIPRRIAEEGGVPRGRFAVAKKAVAVAFALDGTGRGGPKEPLCPPSLSEYRSFRARFAPSRVANARILAAERGAALWTRVINRINWAAKRLGLKFKLKRPLRAYGLRLGRDWPVVHWALAKIAPRYAPGVQLFVDKADRPRRTRHGATPAD